MAHARFSPSKLAQIIACPGSVQLIERSNVLPQTSVYAEEGTLLHAYMDDLVQERPIFIAEAEHRALCKEALNYIRELPNGKTYTEVQVSISGVKDVYGTADFVRITDSEIHVCDYKFGVNKVEVDNNPQFLAYALGVLDTIRCDTTNKIFIHVIQPKVDNFGVQEVSYDHLLKWRDTVLKPALAEAVSDTPKFAPSEAACRWCACKSVCRARYNYVQSEAANVFKAYASIKDTGMVSEEDLVAFYESANDLEVQIKAVRSHVMSELMRGTVIKGYSIAYGKANRKWRDEALAAKYVTEHYDADPEDIYDTKFKSPAQIEKLFKVKKDPEFAKLLFVPQGTPRVVREES